MGHDGQLIAECSAGHKQGGFHAGDFGGQGLQTVDRGVIAIDIIAQFGFEHGIVHRFGGLCYCVAAKIEEIHFFFHIRCLQYLNQRVLTSIILYSQADQEKKLEERNCRANS
ncbi:hypothetical protein SDC9_141078 [bioreactor metagenome]|uniref:Uncharacterized protein n=1 Tax=bioreactor metagenome TaxID=1076179 RepID=A0A645DX65_9ZZZZ